MASLLVNLYCSRVVLQALGVVDYGVYEVVGGSLSLPIYCFTPGILALWLGDYPPYTVEFVRVVLVMNLIEAYANQPWFQAYHDAESFERGLRTIH